MTMLGTISIRNFKSITALELKLNSRHLLLHGPVGSGKTSVIEAVRLGLMHPTKFGERNLSSLGRFGDEWRVRLAFSDGGDVERVQRDSSATLRVDGDVVNKAAYLEAIAGRRASLQPHLADLSAFLELSGSARSDLFAKILGGGETTLGDIVSDIMGRTTTPIEYAARLSSEEVAAAIRWQDVFGTPGVIINALKETKNAAVARARDERTRMEGSVRRLAELNERKVPTAKSVAELNAEIDARNVELGRLQGEREAAEKQREAYMTAARVADRASADLNRARAALIEGRKSQETYAAAVVRKGQLDQILEEAQASAKELDRKRDEAYEAVGAASNHEAAIKANRKLAQELRSREIADDRLHEIAALTMGVEWARACRDPSGKIRAFAEAIRDELVGPSDDAAVAQATVQLGEARSQQEEAVRAFQAAVLAVDHASREEREVAAVVKRGPADIEALTKAVDEADAALLKANADAQGLAVPSDDTALQEQIEAAKESIKEMRGWLRHFDELGAVSGEVESRRRDIRIADAAKDLADAYYKAVQGHVAKKSAEAMQRLLEPLRERLRLVFGCEADMRVESTGSGRSTVTEVLIETAWSGGGTILRPLHMLSAGESVLVGAAFLATLQDIEGVAGILTLDAETLDEPSLRRFLDAVPKLERDLVIIGTNINVEGFDRGALEWQFVEMP